MPTDQPEINEVDYVRKYLEVPTFLFTGVDLRVFCRMGDRLAIAVLKSIYPNQQVNQLQLKKILTAIGAAFEYPWTVDASDRVPAVTLFLLGALKERMGSPEDAEAIHSAIERVKAHVVLEQGC